MSERQASLFFLHKNKKVTDNHTILDVLKILCRKMVLLGKKRGGIKMRNLLNRYLSNLMTFGLEKVATGAATSDAILFASTINILIFLFCKILLS